MEDNTFDAKRRNLLAITVVLFFLKFSEATVSSTASISALSITVNRPEAVFEILWVLWAYFFLRAYQHFHYHLKLPYRKSIQKTLVPILHPHASKSGVPDEYERELHEDLERFFKYELRFNLVACTRGFWSFLKLPIGAFTSALWFKVRASSRSHLNLIRYARLQTGVRSHTPFEVPAWSIVLWTIDVPPRDAPGKMKVNFFGSFDLSFWLGLRLFLRIVLTLTLKSTPFFDYRLPFILALAPVPYYLFAT